MATHSSIPSWKILWTEKPGGLPSVDSQRVRHDWAHQCVSNYFRLLRLIVSDTTAQFCCHRQYTNELCGSVPIKLLTKAIGWTSLVIQWLKIHLAMQDTAKQNQKKKQTKKTIGWLDLACGLQFCQTLDETTHLKENWEASHFTSSSLGWGNRFREEKWLSQQILAQITWEILDLESNKSSCLWVWLWESYLIWVY